MTTDAETQTELAIDDGREAYLRAQARLSEHNAFFTPSALVGQVVARYFSRFSALPPRNVLDVFAGPGIWAKWAVFVGEHRWGAQRPRVTAVELRPEERPWLERNADDCLIGDWRELIGHPTLGGPYDLVIGNPDFAAIHEALPELLRHVVAPGGVVLWLAPNGLGQRGADGWALFDAHTPAEQWRIRGPIYFRKGINPKTGKPFGADVRDYSVWYWYNGLFPRAHAGAATEGWSTYDLPALDSSLLRWDVPPGTEDVPLRLPAEMLEVRR